MGAFIFLFYVIALSFVPLATNGKEQNDNLFNEFAFKLLKEVAKEEGNFVISPYSIEVALGMLYGAARGNSATQLEKLLAIEHLQGGDFHVAMQEFNKEINNLSSANNIWAAGNINVSTAYLKLLLYYYDSKLGFLDTSNLKQATLTVNKWVEKNTGGMIKDFFGNDAITPNTKIIIVNALFFKGKWVNAFPEKATLPGIFYLESGKEVSTKMMSLNEAKLRYYNDVLLNLKIVELPYDDNEFVMWVAVPERGHKVGTILKEINSQSIKHWNEMMLKRKVDVTIPRFSIQKDVNLKKTLINLGLSDPFNRETSDLSGLNNKRNLYVSSAVHKARIDVDEYGTKASAATGISVSLYSLRPESLSVFADRPFLVFIIHRKTQTVIFCGRVSDPR